MDEWQIYHEMAGYGASPIEVAKQAWSDGLNTADATYLLETLFTLADEQIREAIVYGYGQNYVQMVEAGASPNDVLAETSKDQVGRVMTLNIIRFLFNLNEREVGQVLGIAGGRIHQLWNRPL